MSALPLTPEQQARRDHWAQVHIAGDRSPSIGFALRRIVTRAGSGVRFERGKRAEA